MARTLKDKRAAFRALHERGCFVMPNPWDLGGAKRLEKLGFKAIASTSAGFAWSLGRDDYQVSRDELLEHLRVLSAATGLPLNADFENGFADAPGDVAANVKLAIDTGVAGLSIEDRAGKDLYPLPLAVERIEAARDAIGGSGENVMLVARTEGMLIGTLDATKAIERLAAFADAGADCLYAPGVQSISDIESMVAAVAPKPLNVLLLGSSMRVAELAAVGVRRVSIGAGFAFAAWAAFEAAAKSVRDQGHLPGD
ncbi:MAG: isocitrate lyase/PEP mutase family protein [Gammaproteobacteria bacterium]